MTKLKLIIKKKKNNEEVKETNVKKKIKTNPFNFDDFSSVFSVIGKEYKQYLSSRSLKKENNSPDIFDIKKTTNIKEGLQIVDSFFEVIFESYSSSKDIFGNYDDFLHYMCQIKEYLQKDNNYHFKEHKFLEVCRHFILIISYAEPGYGKKKEVRFDFDEEFLNAVLENLKNLEKQEEENSEKITLNDVAIKLSKTSKNERCFNLDFVKSYRPLNLNCKINYKIIDNEFSKKIINNSDNQEYHFVNCVVNRKDKSVKITKIIMFKGLFGKN